MQYHLHMAKFGFIKECFASCFRKKGVSLHLNDRDHTLELSRRALIGEYKMKHKEKFYKLDKQTFHPSYFNKVAPVEAFRAGKPKKDTTRDLESVRRQHV